MGKKGDPLKLLRAFDRLEVGPVEVEPRRLKMPYAVVRDGDLHRNVLIYRWQETVFSRADPAARNLASMIGAQVAVNYGLFCDEIVLRGPFDEADRRFLEDAAENTAREIYVNKFLKPNPFLSAELAGLPALRQEAYSRAKLTFPDLVPAAAATPWAAGSGRHAVLSSGGKDSLLSYGLLEELGAEVHAIFVNESGRHWYTALNAFRHFVESRPSTARVWTNSDRLFSWMLRHLPFIRQDFSRVRSDEYPVRLWTVAVFLFGALPLMRKRAIGRLVIGDEFDTTVRARHQGIPHFAGLYDQSRFFDNAVSRYFFRKGWDVAQFSLLRPLSELLIEKTLVERYPDLQRQQLSCHAAHLEDDGRVRPCGECEKCRRIVGMLIAVDADPRACGYTDEQIRGGLGALQARGVHQEDAGARHLAWMLASKGVIPSGDTGPFPAAANPEVLSLRFDSTRSPSDATPRDLREPVFRILLDHADGAVERRGKVWVRFDPLERSRLARPYRFEGSGERRSRKGEAPVASTHVLGELTWPQARSRFVEVDVALLPVGAIEQHGPHLPLDTDAFDAEYLARAVADACSDPKPLVLPLIPYGVSYHHEDFAGTLSIGPDTMSRVVYEIGMCAAHNGVTKLIVINGHGGNGPALHLAAQMINKDAHIFTCVDSGETSDPDIAEMAETPNDVHAGEIETSTTLAIRPGLVDMSKAPRSVPRFSSGYLDFTSKRGVGWYARTAKISRSGVMGDATRATGEKGKKMWDVMIRRLVELVEDLKGLSLDEIYQRRY